MAKRKQLDPWEGRRKKKKQKVADKEKDQDQEPVPVDQLFQQREQALDPHPELRRLREALRRTERRASHILDAPLQHACDAEQCEWLFVDDEWAVCLNSGNLHICTPDQCQYRDSDARGAQDRKGMGGYSVCILTGRVREALLQTSATPEWRPVGPAVGLQQRLRKKYDQNRATVNAILDKLVPEEQEIPDHLRAQISATCCRVWHALHNCPNKMLASDQKTPMCRFEEMCIAVLYDMARFGLHVRHGDDDDAQKIELLTTVPFLYHNLPDTPTLGKYGYCWNINVSKCVHAALASMPVAELQALGDEFRRIRGGGDMPAVH